jgi:hypothetical protein
MTADLDALRAKLPDLALDLATSLVLLLAEYPAHGAALDGIQPAVSMPLPGAPGLSLRLGIERETGQ